MFVPCLVRGSLGDGQVPRLGDPLLDGYLDMVAARARPNTVLATAFDLKVFFSVVGKEPAEIGEADVLGFIAAQRQPRRGATVVRIEDGEAGLSARTIKRRLASVTGLFEYLIIRGVVAKNPVPQGLSTRSPNRGGRGGPLIRTPRTLPRVIDPDEADALLAALRTHRDRAMVQAMLLGGLRRCEVLGLRLGDVRPGDPGGDSGPGRAPLHRIHPHLPAFGQRLAGRRIPPRGRGHRRPGLRGALMATAPRLEPDAVVVEDYLAAMRAADRRTGRSTTRAARSCQAKIRRAGGWGRLNRAEQLDAVVKAPSFASWLMVTGRITVDAELLSDTDLRLGNAARLYCADDHRWFREICAWLEISGADTTVQWNTLAKA